jgi:hypothetical protein
MSLSLEFGKESRLRRQESFIANPGANGNAARVKAFPSSGRQAERPLYSWAIRLSLCVAAFVLWDLQMQGLLGAVERLFRLQYGVDAYPYEEVRPVLYRKAFAILDAERLNIFAFACFVVGAYWLLTLRPRWAAWLLVAFALLSGGIFLLHMIQVLQIASQPLHFGYLDPRALVSFGADCSASVLAGALALVALAIAEEIDRAAIARAANARVEQSEGGAPEVCRRAKRQRDLVAIVSGGALLPATFFFNLAIRIGEIMTPVESHITLPIATAAHAGEAGLHAGARASRSGGSNLDWRQKGESATAGMVRTRRSAGISRAVRRLTNCGF